MNNVVELKIKNNRAKLVATAKELAVPAAVGLVTFVTIVAIGTKLEGYKYIKPNGRTEDGLALFRDMRGRVFHVEYGTKV